MLVKNWFKFNTVCSFRYLCCISSRAGTVALVYSLVQTEIFQKSLDGLPWNFLQTFMVPRWWMVISNISSTSSRPKYSNFQWMISSAGWTGIKFHGFQIMSSNEILWRFLLRQHKGAIARSKCTFSSTLVCDQICLKNYRQVETCWFWQLIHKM